MGGISLPAGANGPLRPGARPGRPDGRLVRHQRQLRLLHERREHDHRRQRQRSLGPLGSIDVNGQLTRRRRRCSRALRHPPGEPDHDSLAPELQLRGRLPVRDQHDERGPAGHRLHDQHDQRRPGQNQPIVIQPGVMVAAGGHLTITNSFDLAGEFDLTIERQWLVSTSCHARSLRPEPLRRRRRRARLGCSGRVRVHRDIGVNPQPAIGLRP